MKYLSIKTCDFVNGTGIRLTLFVSGCSHACKGCYQKKSWNPNNGLDYTKEIEDNLINELKKPNYDGLSLSGGDPMFKDNREAILKLVERVKAECPNRNIWLWTGYTLAEMEEIPGCKAILEYVDVLVDGKFEEDKKDLTIPFRGSSNQNLIYLAKV